MKPAKSKTPSTATAKPQEASTPKVSSVEVAYCPASETFSFGHEHHSLLSVKEMSKKGNFASHYDFVAEIGSCFITYAHLYELIRQADNGHNLKLTCRAKTPAAENEYRQLGNQVLDRDHSPTLPSQPRQHPCCSNCGAPWCKCNGDD